MNLRILTVLAGLLVSPALAAPTAPTADAKKQAGAHYQRGVAFYKENNFSAAHAEFKAAYQALPSFEVLFNIGLSERRLFKYGQAMRTLNRYLLEGGAKVPKDRQAAVAQEIELIKSVTAPIAVIVNGPPARLLIDGEEVATTPLNEMLLLAPGKHVVRAEREGDAPEERTIEVVSGNSQAVTLELKNLKAPVAVSIDSEPAGAMVSVDGAAPVKTPAQVQVVPGTHELLATAERFQPARIEIIVSPGQPRSAKLVLVAAAPVVAAQGPRPFPVLGVTVAGAGLLLGGGGAFFALQAQAAARKVTDFSKVGGTWDPTWAAVQSDGQRSQLFALVLIGGGALALASGLVMSAVTLFGPAPPAEAAGVSVIVLPDFAGGGTVACAVRF